MADRITLSSEAQTFAISPKTSVANGVIAAIRVQDVAKQKWFNWDVGAGWDEVPVVSPGKNNLYIAFWVVNEGETGEITLSINDDRGLIAWKTDTIEAGVGIGVECTIDMPSGKYLVEIKAVPGGTRGFTIGSTEILGLSLTQVALLGVTAVSTVIGVVALSRSRR